MESNYAEVGDCIDVMRTMPDACVDMIYVDPPYNLALPKANDLVRPNNGKIVEGVRDDWDQFDTRQEYKNFTQAWLTECKRLLTPDGTIWVQGTYHNIYTVGSIMMDLDYWILNDVVWVKANPMPNFRGVRLTNAHEILIWASKSKQSKYCFNYHDLKQFNDGKQLRSDWYGPVCRGKERLVDESGAKLHPTQKPEYLLERIILASTLPGQLILDPFFGTGTTGVVAERLNRRWIGIDSNESYIEAAMTR